MSRLDCSSAEVKAALEEVSNPSGSNEWAVFGYVPKSGNVIKVDSKGSGFDDMVEEFSEGKVQYAYYRVPLKGASKFVYVAWCGEGVIGMAKGSFGNHSNDFGAHLKKGFAVHHQVNARSEADLDEKKIQAALVKAAGANYDAGAKKQGMDSTAKAMGELKTFHISEQARAVEVGTGRASGASGAAIDKAASDQFWQANKSQPKAAAPPPSRPAVDEEARKQFWQQQQQEQAAAKAASAKAPVGRPAPAGGASALKNRFEAGSAAPPASGPPPARPAPGKVNTGAFTAKPTAAPPSGPPKLPPSAPPSGPPSSLPPPVGRPAPGGPPPVPAAAPPVSAPPPAMPPRMPEPEATQEDDGWGDDSAAAAPPAAPAQEEYAAPAQEEYAQEEYAQEEYAQEEYAQEEYAQEEYAAPAQEEYAQEEYAQEEYAQEEYAQEEYAQEEYAGQEEYAQEEYAGQEEYGYTQVQALHDYAGQHDEDLSFSAGDWITVHERDESGWWKGELNGRTGYFPSNFVQQ